MKACFHRGFLAGLALLAIVNCASALTIPVNCPPNGHIGDITVNAVAGGISGGFSSLVPNNPGPPTLAGAAAACGEHHFNWYQIVTADNQPPPGFAPPYVDPPPGGYPISFDPTWADNFPWYWDEFAPNPVPPGRTVNNQFQLSNRTHPNLLDFFDFPSGGNGLQLSFKTWLVSVNANGSLHSFHEGFSWNFSIPAGGGQGTVANIAMLNAAPTDAEFANITSAFAPEPSTLLFMTAGALLLVIRRRKA